MSSNKKSQKPRRRLAVLGGITVAAFVGFSLFVLLPEVLTLLKVAVAAIVGTITSLSILTNDRQRTTKLEAVVREPVGFELLVSGFVGSLCLYGLRPWQEPIAQALPGWLLCALATGLTFFTVWWSFYLRHLPIHVKPTVIGKERQLGDRAGYTVAMLTGLVTGFWLARLIPNTHEVLRTLVTFVAGLAAGQLYWASKPRKPQPVQHATRERVPPTPETAVGLITAGFTLLVLAPWYATSLIHGLAGIVMPILTAWDAFILVRCGRRWWKNSWFGTVLIGSQEVNR